MTITPLTEIREILDRCLLSADEIGAGLDAWKRLDAPFSKRFAEQSEG
jgi:hypothetical protein